MCFFYVLSGSYRHGANRSAARDTISNQVAVDMVSEVVAAACNASCTSWRDTSGLQQAAEALTLEAYVRGSRDNIGVVVVAIV